MMDESADSDSDGSLSDESDINVDVSDKEGFSSGTDSESDSQETIIAVHIGQSVEQHW